MDIQNIDRPVYLIRDIPGTSHEKLLAVSEIVLDGLKKCIEDIDSMRNKVMHLIVEAQCVQKYACYIDGEFRSRIVEILKLNKVSPEGVSFVMKCLGEDDHD